jgi:hypothetical protein
VHDIDVRNAWRTAVRAQFADDPSTRFIEELVVGESRIDGVAVNGALHGYEIKSDSDTLERLPSQARSYNAIFDEVTVIVGACHLEAVAAVVPSWWGISLAQENDGEIRITTVRPTDRNPDPDPSAVASLLWRQEALEVLEAAGAADGYRSKPRAEIAKRLARAMAIADLGRAVRERLKAREGWRSGPTPFRNGDSSRSAAMSRRFQENRRWLLSLGSQCPQR